MSRRRLTSYARPSSRRSRAVDHHGHQAITHSNRIIKLSKQISTGDRQRTGLERHGTLTSSANSQAERGRPLRARQAAASQASRMKAGVQKMIRKRAEFPNEPVAEMPTATAVHNATQMIGGASDARRSSGGSPGTRA